MSTDQAACKPADDDAPGLPADWTADPQTGRSNSSAPYQRLVSEVARLIRDEAYQLLRGNTEAAAALIMAQLAHVHGLAPSYRVPGCVLVSLDDLRLVACPPEDSPPDEGYPGALRRLRAAVGAGTLDQRQASDPPQPSDSDDPPPAGLDAEPVAVTRDDLLSEWRKTHPGECSCPPGRTDPSCPQQGSGTSQVTASRGAELIAAERARQVGEEGWTAEHDAEHDYYALVQAAIAYAVNGVATQDHVLSWWPWDEGWFKPGPNRTRDLVKAGALIAAAIDRLSAAAEAGG